MNCLSGTIANITTQGSLSLVKVQVGEVELFAIVIDTPKTSPYLQLGQPVNVIFKETEVIVGQGYSHAVSLQNRLRGQVRSLESNALLSQVVLDTTVGPITSIITTHAVHQLRLAPGIEVTAMIKTNEVMLSAVSATPPFSTSA